MRHDARVRTALLFPGQASQRPGMGAAWVGTPGWELVDRASQVLDRDVAWLLLHASAEELRPTAQAQLAVFVTSLVVLAGLPPAQEHAGHSLGEITALTAAGALDVEDGLRVVAERGAAMHDTAPGTMASVLGLGDEGFEDLPDGAWAANWNAPSHVVVSGTVAGVSAAGAVLKERGARRVLPLPVGGAFHTPLMEPARPRLEAALAAVTWHTPRVPVWQAETTRPYDGDATPALSRQLTAPVRWRHLLERLDVDRVVEVGPGGVLTGLAKRTRPDLPALSVASPADLDQL